MKTFDDYLSVVVAAIFFILIVIFLFSCGWKTTTRPPLVNSIEIVETLLSTIESKKIPESKEVLRKVLLEINSKMVYIEDGEITLNDAFNGIIAVIPLQYKPIPVLMKAKFNSIIGDIGKQAPEEVKAKIQIVKQIIQRLQTSIED